MKTKKYAYSLSGMLLGLVTLLTLGGGKVAAAPFTCTWTGGGSDSKFSTAANWSNCNSAAPTSGDSLVFDGSASNKAPTNDISSLSIANISFTNAAGFTVSGVGFTVTGGITDNSTGNTSNAFDTNLTFSGSQTITGSHAPTGGLPLELGLATNETITLSSGTLTISTIGVSFGGALSGSGGLTLSSSQSILSAQASNFSGPIVLSGASALNPQDVNNLGTGSITINSGSTLFILQTSSPVVLANALNLAGSGAHGLGAINAEIGTCTGPDGCPASSQLTLSGPVSLSANTVVEPNASKIVLTGTFTSNGFTLTAASGSVTLPTSGTGSGTAAPKTPNTGLAAVKSNPLVVLGAASASALTLAILASRTRKAPARARR